MWLPPKDPLPSCQGRQPPSLSGCSHALCSLSSLWGVLPHILRWNRLNPVPTATPAWAPRKWGPHVQCGRMSRPGLPRTRREATLGAGDVVGGSSEREPTGNRHLPPAWKDWEAPSEGMVGHGHRMLPWGTGIGGRRRGAWGRGAVRGGSSLAVLLWP